MHVKYGMMIELGCKCTVYTCLGVGHSIVRAAQALAVFFFYPLYTSETLQCCLRWFTKLGGEIAGTLGIT